VTEPSESTSRDGILQLLKRIHEPLLFMILAVVEVNYEVLNLNPIVFRLYRIRPKKSILGKSSQISCSFLVRICPLYHYISWTYIYNNVSPGTVKSLIIPRLRAKPMSLHNLYSTG